MTPMIRILGGLDASSHQAPYPTLLSFNGLDTLVRRSGGRSSWRASGVGVHHG